MFWKFLSLPQNYFFCWYLWIKGFNISTKAFQSEVPYFLKFEPPLKVQMFHPVEHVYKNSFLSSLIVLLY